MKQTSMEASKQTNEFCILPVGGKHNLKAMLTKQGLTQIPLCRVTDCLVESHGGNGILATVLLCLISQVAFINNTSRGCGFGQE